MPVVEKLAAARAVFVVTLSGLCLLVIPACTVTGGTTGPETKYITPTRSVNQATNSERVFKGDLKVLTLNLAHGRKDSLNQLLLSEQVFRKNLEDIAGLFKKVGADIVALQEADGPSRWSGNFDHVKLLAQQAGYPWYARAIHASGNMYNFGTALLSKAEFSQVLNHSFSPSPPSLTKGFILGQAEWIPDDETRSPVIIDILSIHLDFLSADVRQKQIQELISVMAGRKHPVIMLGDFNDDLSTADSVLNEVINRCQLVVFRPLAKDLVTYKKNAGRFDWILISKNLGFKNYTVLPEVLSDHNAVMAEIYFKNQQPQKAGCN